MKSILTTLALSIYGLGDALATTGSINRYEMDLNITAIELPNPETQSNPVTLLFQLANGQLNVNFNSDTLPTNTVPLHSMFTEVLGCENNIATSAPNTRVYFVNFLIFKDAQQRTGQLRLSSSDGLVNISWIYADNDTTIAGAINCPGAATQFDLSLKQGWNVAVTSSSTGPSGMVVRQSTPTSILNHLDWSIEYN